MRTLFVCLAFSLWPALAVAALPGLPVDLGAPQNYARAGQCTAGHEVYVATPGTSYVRTSTAISADNWNRPMLVPFGSLVSLTCDADVIACWVQAEATITSTTGVLTDAGSTSGETVGIGGCFKIEAGSYRDQTLWRSASMPSTDYGNAHRQLSTRDISCDSTDAETSAAIDGYPCDAASDCYYTATTCTSANGTPAGNFLALRPAAASATSCWFCLER